MAEKTHSPRPVQTAVRISTIGHRSSPFDDLYHRVLRWPWWAFFSALVAGFLSINLFFATLYWLSPGAVSHVFDFEDAFYFSVQTLATIGYGTMAPQTRYAHVVVVVEALTGILSVAVVTGATFAKFARPTARVLFAKAAVVYPRDGVPHLMFRMANWRQNSVVEAQLRAIVLISETTAEGERLRRPLELQLVRDRTAVFQLSWTAMHRIDDKSPFFGDGAIERLRGQEAEMFLSLSGLDETVGQTIHARYRYAIEDIVWNARFADVFSVLPDGKRVIDYTHFHEIVRGE
jgi:inward rectifier potassium channel